MVEVDSEFVSLTQGEAVDGEQVAEDFGGVVESNEHLALKVCGHSETMNIQMLPISLHPSLAGSWG